MVGSKIMHSIFWTYMFPVESPHVHTAAPAAWWWPGLAVVARLWPLSVYGTAGRKGVITWQKTNDKLNICINI